MPAKRDLICAAAVVAMFVTAAAALAECQGRACVGVKIERLYVRDHPTVLISTDGAESQLTCQPVEGRYIELRETHAKAEEIYSLLLAAKLADHDVWIRIHESPEAPCSVLYVVLE